jgi:cytochrome c biogenesis protein CcdA
MTQWVTETLKSASMGPAALPLAFLLGLLSAIASACCTLPAMGMLVAYSGTREAANRQAAFVSAISFMIGTTLALIVLGFVAGFVGQAAQALLGRYWKLFAGFIAVVLGLAALKLLPLKLPGLNRKTESRSAGQGIFGTVVVGLLMGGGVAAASLPCNPGIFIVIGASVLIGSADPLPFFTGKGGVGKTSLACASAIALADRGGGCCWSAPTRPRIWMKCWE